MKLYYTEYLEGSRRCRYWVFFHDGKQFHKDGSAFYAAQTFSNKPETAAFIKGLRREGYKERSMGDWPETVLITTQEAV